MNWSAFHTSPGSANVYGTGEGGNFGLQVQSQMANNFYLIGSLFYIEKRVPWLIHPYLESNGSDLEYQLHFTQFSLSVKKEFPVYNMRPYIIAGGSYGYLASLSAIDARFGQASTIDMTGNLKSSDLDLNLGLGLAYTLSQTITVFAEDKYSYDLLNLSEHSGWFLNTKTTQLWCGFLFGI